MKVNTIKQRPYGSAQLFAGLKISQNARHTLRRYPIEYLERLAVAKTELDSINTIDVLLTDSMIFQVVKSIKKNSNEKEKHPFLQKVINALTPKYKKTQLDYLKNIELEMEYSGQMYKTDCRGDTYYGRWSDIPNTLTTLWNSLGIKNIKQEYMKFKQLDKLAQAVYLAKQLDKVESKKDSFIQTF